MDNQGGEGATELSISLHRRHYRFFLLLNLFNICLDFRLMENQL